MRWAWLVVLPWAVVLPENQEKNCLGMNGAVPCVAITASYKGHPAYDCLDEESCKDFVDAMNEAHERRQTGPGGSSGTGKPCTPPDYCINLGVYGTPGDTITVDEYRKLYNGNGACGEGTHNGKDGGGCR